MYRMQADISLRTKTDGSLARILLQPDRLNPIVPPSELPRVSLEHLLRRNNYLVYTCTKSELNLRVELLCFVPGMWVPLRGRPGMLNYEVVGVIPYPLETTGERG